MPFPAKPILQQSTLYWRKSGIRPKTETSYLFLQFVCIRAAEASVDKSFIYVLVEIDRGIKILQYIG